MPASARPILIATRGSALALAQARFILAKCRAAFPRQRFDLKIIKTTGDKLQTASLASSSLPKGLFTKELELALLKGEADLAVHSLKDLPTDLPAGLGLGAVSRRADARDVLLYRAVESSQYGMRGFKPRLSLRGLPRGATVATSSTRRRAQLLERRPDLRIVPIRGNVGTRLRKLATQPEMGATILAAAGLARLHFKITRTGQLRGEGVPPGLCATPIPPEEMLPCVGQAALGIEIRAGDARLEKICAKLNHAPTEQCVAAERAFLHAMGGGCQLAVAAYAQIVKGRLHLRAVSFLGPRARRASTRGSPANAVVLGRRLAVILAA